MITIKDTFYVKRLLEQYEFEEDNDYITKSPKSGWGLDYFLKGEIFMWFWWDLEIQENMLIIIYF